MTVLKAARTTQDLVTSEFTFNFDDTMTDKDGVSKDFKTTGTSIVADVINLPPNSVIVSGEVVTETAVAGSTAYNISVGDSGSATRYLGATSIKSAARTALTLTGYRGTGEDVRRTFANAGGDATAGTVSVRVQYIVTGRTNETQIA